MKKLSISLISCAALAIIPTACAENETNPPAAETVEEAPKKSSFNFNIPGGDTVEAPSSGFNFTSETEAKEGKTALGNVDLPVDGSAAIETFDTELDLPTAETPLAE